MQIKQNLDVSLTSDASELRRMLELPRIPFNSVVKLNMQIAEVQCNFITKPARFCLSRLVKTRITLITDQ